MNTPIAEITRSVREAWLAGLGIDEAGGEENFFALGGESLGAAAVVEEINHRLGLDLRLKDIYREATLDALTALAIRASAAQPGSWAPSAQEPAPGLQAHQDPVGGATRQASLAQEWTLAFIEHPSQQGIEPFLIQHAFHLRGRLDFRRVQDAVDRVVERHELLRSTFVRSRDGIRLRIDADARVVVELSEIGHGTPRDVLRAEAGRGFDPYAAPAVRCKLFRLTPDDHVLLFVFDHIIADGGSVEVLLNDFTEAYAGRRLPPVATPFTVWAAEQRRITTSPAKAEEYWRDSLGADPSIVSTPFRDYHRPELERADGTSITLNAEQRTAVTEVARLQKVTVYALVLGSLLISLRDRVSRHEFCVVTTSANRTARTMRTFGPLAHDVYIAVDLTLDRGLSQAAAYAQQKTADALTHATLPSTAIAESLWPQTGPEIHTMPAFYFSANRPWASRFRLEGVRLEELRFASRTAMPGLECTLEHDDRTMTLNLRYLADSFPPGYARRLGEETIQRIISASG